MTGDVCAMKLVCKQCHNEFDVAPYVVKNGWGKYCSIDCYHKSKRGHARFSNRLEDADWMRSQYRDLKKSSQTIANELNVDDSTVILWLRRHKIEVRSIIKSGDFKSKDWLYNQYWDKQKSMNIIASEQGVSYYTIDRWMKIFKIPKRSYVDATTGDKNSRWLGGKSFEPYCIAFTKKLKEEVRDAFGRKCYLCQKTESENGKKLDVHHVDYNKSQGCAGLRWSLIPLCRSCHRKTTINRFHYYAALRDYWIHEHLDFTNDGWIE